MLFLFDVLLFKSTIMRKTEVLALGKIGPDELIVSVSDSTRKIESSIEERVDLIWEEKKEEGRCRRAPLLQWGFVQTEFF